MNKHSAELLEKHFDTAFAAPDGIKKLRELILTLAMRGQLVPQDPNDPPASELLKEIEAEKQRLVKEGKIKKPKPLPPVTEEEKPYVLPQGWEWVRLGSVIEILDHLRKPVTKKDRQPGPYPYYGASGVVDYVSKYIFDEPLVLVGEDGAKWECGDKTAFSIHGKTWVNNHAHVIRPKTSALIGSFLVYLLVGMDLRPYITGITVPKLNQARLLSILIPLAPLPEQHRIVAKIDELMARCDELEKLRTAQQEQRLTTHTAAIQQLLNIAESNQHQRAQTFLAEHFGELYSVKENVAELRKAILQLAVMGKLVPQNPNDPPASELLQEIEAEKQRLVKEGKIRKPKALPPVTDEEKPYALPKGWEWVRLGDVSEKIHYGYTAPADHSNQNVRLLRITDIQENNVDWDTVPGCDAKKEDVGQYLLANNNILIARTGGTVGKSYLVQGINVDAVFASYLIRVVPSNCINVRFVKYFAEGPLYWRQLYAACSGTGQPNVNGTSLSQLHMALPPLAEQHRIVTKIDELMALCDTLDQQIDTAATKQAELLNALMLAQSQVITTGEPQQTPLHCHESSGDPHDPPRYAPRSGNRAPVVTA